MSSPPDPNSTPSAASTSIDLSTERHVTRLHRAVIGPVSTGYYLPVLERLDTRERAIPIWNWAACLVTLNWMVFRGLWEPALLYVCAVLGAALGVLGLIRLAAPMAESMQWGLWAALLTLALLIPGFFGNAWMYGVYRRRMAQALAATTSVQDACNQLGRQAGSRRRIGSIALANVLVAGVLVAAFMWQPPRYAPTAVNGDISMAAPKTSLGRADVAPAIAFAASASASATASLPQTPSAVALAATASEAASTSVAPPTASTAAPAATPVAAASAAAIGPTPSPSEASAPAPAEAAPVPELRRSTRFGAVAPERQASRPATTAPTPAATSDGRFLVNVGLFAKEENARRAHTRLRDEDLPAFTDALQRPSGTLTRVRVGPFATRAEAYAAALSIRAMDLDAVVSRQ